MADSPVIISDDDNEEYFSPPTDDKRSKDDLTSATKRFTANFTATGEDVIDLTMDSSNPSSGVQTPESSQQPAYPHIKLLDFLSPAVSPKDLATSIKKRSNVASSQLSTNVTSSPAMEPASAGLADTSTVPHYGVTARSPESSGIDQSVTSSVRQISPPQNPDELKRATLLPLDERTTTHSTSLTPSCLMSARVSIHKLDSPSSALTASIAKGTVSLRKERSQRQVVQTSHHLSNTISSITTSSKLSSPYKFSPPVEVTSSDKTNNTQEVNRSTYHQSPSNVSFPFSPPLTRSRRRQTIEQDSLDGSKVELFTERTSEMDPEPSVDMPEVNESKQTGKKKARVSTSEVTTTRTYQTRYTFQLP